jgi:hypothetical protein
MGEGIKQAARKKALRDLILLISFDFFPLLQTNGRGKLFRSKAERPL